MRRHAEGGRAHGRPGDGAAGLSTALSDVVGFLREHPPFDAVAHDDVERVAGVTEVEFFGAGDTIIEAGERPVEWLRVVRSGAVEIVHDGAVLDLLGEGELLGHASMLSGLPAGFTARAHEDTLCYRIPASAATGLLARPESVGYVARSLLARAELIAADHQPRALDQEPVGTLLRAPPVICPPDTPVAEAARQMTAAGASAVVVALGDSLGIVTDRDLRSRVIAAGMSPDQPVSEAMTAPAYTVGPDRLGGEVLLDMLDRGFRHFPVVAATGEILGVIDDADLVAAETRSSFHLRRAIARADSVADVVSASAQLQPTVFALYDARVPALNISAVFSVVADALTRRLLEIVMDEMGPPPAEFSWLALGSQARREAALSSDVDSAIVWFGDAPDDEVRPYLQAMAERVVSALEECGFTRDQQRATAADALFIRSVHSWRRAVHAWLDDPTLEQALILVSVVVDSRPVWGLHAGTPVSEAFRPAPKKRALLRQLARFSLQSRPPTGFLRGLVVEHGGEHRGRLDIKHGGILPIAGLARWAGMAAGVTSASTIERLRVAGEAGTLDRADARTLEDAYELVCGLRLEHQIQQARAGDTPDNFLDPEDLSPLTRSYLREAFRAVASVQKRVSNELTLGVR
jgi:CBS domain-containing protein